MGIRSVLGEERVVVPSADFVAKARYDEETARMKRAEARDFEAYWMKEAQANLSWFKAPKEGLATGGDARFEWFADGELNASYNCLDRHLPERAHKEAIIWEGEDGTQRRFTYAALTEAVARFAGALERAGLSAGDVVTLYMPMVPECFIAMQACARLGLCHNVVFAGFSAEALATRVRDARSKLVICADGCYRKGKVLLLKTVVDEALESDESLSDARVVVFERLGQDRTGWVRGRDTAWSDFIAGAPRAEARPFPAETPLFMLYTSGSTGRPKGLVHTTGGYLTQAHATFRDVFDWQEDDVFWCTADAGWITGHSYGAYGPLSNGATIVLYEGAPQTPHWGRFWEICARHGVSILYTAPTAIRAFMKYDPEGPKRYDLSKLRLLGSVGEPINPEAWMWYHREVGRGRCPIVDTWWQTETGAMMIAGLPGAVAAKPGSASTPVFGIGVSVVDEAGVEVSANEGGYLVLDHPWPAMARTIKGDHDRYIAQYWSRYPGRYFTGDGARIDADGYVWIMGRIDDVLNVSGHRLSTMEIESSLVAHEAVAEAAVVARPCAVKGQAICCFVTLGEGHRAEGGTAEALRQHVARHIGALARPDEVRIADALPKTRSGKIMRRLLRDIAEGRELTGDTSTLESPAVLEALVASAPAAVEG